MLLHPDADAEELGLYHEGPLSFTYQVHRLWHLDPEELLATPDLAALAPLAAVHDPAERRQLLERALERVAALPAGQARQAAAWAGVLGNLYLDQSEIDDALKRSVMPIDIQHLSMLALKARPKDRWRCCDASLGIATAIRL